MISVKNFESQGAFVFGHEVDAFLASSHLPEAEPASLSGDDALQDGTDDAGALKGSDRLEFLLFPGLAESAVLEIGHAQVELGVEGGEQVLASSAAAPSAGKPGIDYHGNWGNNIRSGTPRDDTMNGWGGNDYLEGLGGDDQLDGFWGHDTLKGGDGDDLLIGHDGDDVLMGGPGADTHIGMWGFDIASYGEADGPVIVDLARPRANTGEAAGDVLEDIEGVHGTIYADVIRGDSSGNNILGMHGNDTLVGRGGHDILRGGSGDDLLKGNAGHDELFGEDGADTLIGNGGNDRLLGWGGDDDLRGGAGRDYLDGGQGADRLWGGAGGDTFVFRNRDGNDTIMDFDPKDRLRFTKKLVGGETDPLAVVNAYAEVIDGSVVFDFGNGDRVTLAGVASLNGLHRSIEVGAEML